MTHDTRDPVTDEAGKGSEEARLFAPRNGGPPGDVLTAPGSRNRSEETVDVDEEGGEGDVEGIAEEEEDLDEEDGGELLDEESDEEEDDDEEVEA